MVHKGGEKDQATETNYLWIFDSPMNLVRFAQTAPAYNSRARAQKKRTKLRMKEMELY